MEISDLLADEGDILQDCCWQQCHPERRGIPVERERLRLGPENVCTLCIGLPKAFDLLGSQNIPENKKSYDYKITHKKMKLIAYVLIKSHKQLLL